MVPLDIGHTQQARNRFGTTGMYLLLLLAVANYLQLVGFIGNIIDSQLRLPAKALSFLSLELPNN